MIRLMCMGVACLVLVGCNERGIVPLVVGEPLLQPIPPRSVTKTDIITQVVSPRVDTLFVVDNSCSMDDEQAALGDNFPYFIDFFVDSGLDFHVGVTSTDMTSAGHGNQGRLRQAAGARFIDRNTPNPSQVFHAMAAMGTSGSPIEQGLAATYAALELERDEHNVGFFREDASLHTVVMTDEPNQRRPGDLSVGEFIDWYDRLKRTEADRTFSGIINRSGTDYAAVTLAIGGSTWDIDDGQWRQVLQQLGLQAVGLRREYFLSARPVPGTIEVEIREPAEEPGVYNSLHTEQARWGDGGALLNEAGAIVWDHLDDRNSIRFLDFVPPARSQIVITYTLLSATQEPSPPTR